ncbi:MAG: hypothetical protein ABI477_24000 [Chryseolinea sp.]
MIPDAGQLSSLIPQPTSNYRIITESRYVIPGKGWYSLVEICSKAFGMRHHPAQTLKVINGLRETGSKMRS